MAHFRLLPAGTGVGLRLEPGQQLRVIDIEGGQTGDLMAIAADTGEQLSNGRTFDYSNKIYFSTGDVLWSERSRPMLSIASDQAGRHDFLLSACSIEMYRIQYGIEGYHANCHDNLRSALREFGMEPESLATPFNLFMNVEVRPDGRFSVAPPRSKAGDAIVFRAEMPVVVAVSSCPASTCNGGAPIRPLAYEILEG